MNFNKQQQAAIKTCDKNLVVTAGAGAGKTTVLSERFLYLLSQENCQIDQILTMTFTDKAAGEMRERIRARLIESNQSFIQNQLPMLGSAAILTLDSFCWSIAKNHLSHYGLPAISVPDEDGIKELTRERAIHWIVENQENELLKSLIHVEGTQSIFSNLLVPIASEFFSLVTYIDFKELYQQQMNLITKLFLKSVESINSLVTQMKDINVETQTGLKWSQFCDALSTLADYENDQLLRELKGSEISLFSLKIPRKIGTNTKKPGDVEMRIYAQSLITHFTLCRSFLPYFENSDYFLNFYQLIGQWQDVILKARREAGVLTFQEVAQMAVDLLRRNKTLRNYYKEQYRYIMVDEFQDNNQLQRDLLFLLAENEDAEGVDIPLAKQLAQDKLFFVGDEKQSVYRFRGADVSVFKKLGVDLVKNGGEQLALSINYRSEPGLITFFNEYFETLFPDSSCALDYEADFKPLKSREPSLGEPSRVELLISEKVSSGTQEGVRFSFSEADAVINLMMEYYQQGVKVSGGKDKPPRACGWGDFAILFRTISVQHRFERILRQKKIPYFSQTVTSFFAESIFNDYLALFELILYPDDQLSYASILRSSLVALSDEDIAKILLEKTELFEVGSQIVSSQVEKSMQHCKELYLTLKGKADWVPLTHLVDIIWFDFGYQRLYLDYSMGEPLIEHFDYFRSLAYEADQQSKNLSTFCSWCRKRAGEYKKLDINSMVGDNLHAVKLMSIHKSKGLEFPITILADCGKGTTDFDGKKLFYGSKDVGPVFHLLFHDIDGKRVKADALYKIAKEKNQKMEDAELNRLIYVGMTRAKDHLIISGFSRQKKSGTSILERIEGFFQEKLGLDHHQLLIKEKHLLLRRRQFQDKSLKEILNSENNQLNQLEGDKKASTVHAPLPTFFYQKKEEAVSQWAHKKKSEIVMPLDSQKIVLSALDSDEYLSQVEKEETFGILCHDLLEFHFNGVVIGELRDEGLPTVIGQFPKGKRASILKDALSLVYSFLESSYYQQMNLESALSIQTEADFLLQHPDREGYYLRGRVDLMVENRDEVIIYDYKTDRLLDKGAYNNQLECYVKAYSLITGKHCRGELIFLRQFI